jgi:hypothetical protein
MAVRNYSNTAAKTALTSGVSAGAGSLTVDSTTGYPAPPFYITVDRGKTTEEVVLVTAVGGNVFTATRGADGTSQAAHDAGASVEHTIVAVDLREANAHVYATTGVHGLVPGDAPASDAALTALTGRVTTAEGDVDSLEGRVTTAEGAIATLQSDMTALQGRVTTAEGTIGTLGTRVTTLEGEVDTLEGRKFVKAGSASIPWTNTTGSGSVSFGGTAFASAPTVVTTIRHAQWESTVTGTTTTTGCTISVRFDGSQTGSGNVNVYWVAVGDLA